MRMRILSLVLLIVGAMACHSTIACCDQGVDLSQGQLIYVPVYSSVYGGPRNHSLNLTATLSIRNVDEREPLVVTSVKYFDSDGRLIKVYLDKDQSLGPLATTQFIVDELDTTGGFGPKFLVEWKSQWALTPPIVECIMIGSGQGISFVTQGTVIRDQSD